MCRPVLGQNTTTDIAAAMLAAAATPVTAATHVYGTTTLSYDSHRGHAVPHKCLQRQCNFPTLTKPLAYVTEL